MPAEEPVKNELEKSAISDISGLGKSPFVMNFNIPDDASNIGRESLPAAQLQPNVEPGPQKVAFTPEASKGSSVAETAEDKKLRVELTLKAAELRKSALQIDDLKR